MIQENELTWAATYPSLLTENNEFIQTVVHFFVNSQGIIRAEMAFWDKEWQLLKQNFLYANWINQHVPMAERINGLVVLQLPFKIAKFWLEPEQIEWCVSVHQENKRFIDEIIQSHYPYAHEIYFIPQDESCLIQVKHSLYSQEIILPISIGQFDIVAKRDQDEWTGEWHWFVGT